jgi:hypothetical protein
MLFTRGGYVNQNSLRRSPQQQREKFPQFKPRMTVRRACAVRNMCQQGSGVAAYIASNNTSRGW